VWETGFHRAISDQRAAGLSHGKIKGMTTPRTGGRRAQRKAKKSYTLSPESVAFLEGLLAKRRAKSVSSILEEILQNLRRENERASVEQAVADYYSSLTESEMTEQAAWGEFALRQLPNRENT